MKIDWYVDLAIHVFSLNSMRLGNREYSQAHFPRETSLCIASLPCRKRLQNNLHPLHGQRITDMFDTKADHEVSLDYDLVVNSQEIEN